MPAQLWWAHLYPQSPRYATWREILGSDNVPLAGPGDFDARTEDGNTFRAYRLDVDMLDAEQRARLVTWVGQNFGATVGEVEARLRQDGFPIREADVLVAFSMRAFM